MNRIFGVVLFAVGLVLLFFAYQASNAPLERLSDTFTGHYSNQTMTYLVLGLIGVIGGGLLSLRGRRV